MGKKENVDKRLVEDVLAFEKLRAVADVLDIHTDKLEMDDLKEEVAKGIECCKESILTVSREKNRRERELEFLECMSLYLEMKSKDIEYPEDSEDLSDEE